MQDRSPHRPPLVGLGRLQSVNGTGFPRVADALPWGFLPSSACGGESPLTRGLPRPGGDRTRRRSGATFASPPTWPVRGPAALLGLPFGAFPFRRAPDPQGPRACLPLADLRGAAAPAPARVSFQALLPPEVRCAGPASRTAARCSPGLRVLLRGLPPPRDKPPAQAPRLSSPGLSAHRPKASHPVLQSFDRRGEWPGPFRGSTPLTRFLRSPSRRSGSGTRLGSSSNPRLHGIRAVSGRQIFVVQQLVGLVPRASSAVTCATSTPLWLQVAPPDGCRGRVCAVLPGTCTPRPHHRARLFHDACTALSTRASRPYATAAVTHRDVSSPDVRRMAAPDGRRGRDARP